MKTLVTTTAIGLMLALPVSAETKTNTDMKATTSTDSAQVSAQSSASSDVFFKTIPHSLNASNLIGKRVYVSEKAMDPSQPVKASEQDWNDIGEVSDVVIGMDGSVDAVLVDVGGFLGIGEKTVAISMDTLSLIPDGNSDHEYFVVVKGSKDMLDQAPAYEGNKDGIWTDANANASMNADGSAAVDTAAQKMDNAGDNAKQAASDATDEAKQMATDAAQQTQNAADATGQKVKDAANDTGAAMKNAADNTGEAMKDAANTTGEAAKNAANETGSAIDNAVDSTAAAVGQIGQADAANGQKVDIASVDPDALRGEGIYGPNDDKVGDVSELVQGTDGKIEGVVIDVGGFLGIGAKPVEIKADQLTVLKNDTSITVHTNLTEEQLKKLPKYEG